MSHPLLDYLHAAADGRFPAVDGAVTVVPALQGGWECSMAFTGHALIATALSARQVGGLGPNGFGGCLSVDFILWLAGPEGTIGVIEATLFARGRGDSRAAGQLQRRADLEMHSRLQHPTLIRTEVKVYGDERGLVTLGTGIGGRREISVAAVSDGLDRDWGRALLTDALGLVPDGEPVFAAVSPGNARSLRAFLGVGFTPIGSEVLIRPARPPSISPRAS